MARLISQNIPHELKALEAWVLWRFDAKGKKPPFSAATGRRKGWNTDPVTFDAAARAMGMMLTLEGVKAAPADGVGFVLSNGYAGIDLDNCVFQKDGRNTSREWMRPILAAAKASDCYVEFSPSGKGVHIIGRYSGEPPLPGNQISVPHDPSEPAPEKPCNLEMYAPTGGQYFTVSGDRLKEITTIGPIGPAWEAALAVVQKYAPEKLRAPEVQSPPGPAPSIAPKPSAAVPSIMEYASPGGSDEDNVEYFDSDGPMRIVNDLAMRHEHWFPTVFPQAKKAPNGAFKLEPSDLGRGATGNRLSVLLGAVANAGITDWWMENEPEETRGGRRTPVDLLLPPYSEFAAEEYSTATTPKEAVLLLLRALGPEFESQYAGRFRSDSAPEETPESMDWSVPPTNLLLSRDSSIPEIPWPAGTLPVDLERLAAQAASRRAAWGPAMQFATLATVMAAVPAGVRVDALGDGTWMPSASIFAAVVGRSGTAKSATWGWTTAPIEDAEKRWREEHKRAMADYEMAVKIREEAERRRKKKPALALTPNGDPMEDDEDAGPGGDIGPEPKRRRRLVDNFTMEKLQVMMAESPEGLIAYADELAGLVGNLDRYSQGSRGGSPDSASLLNMYDGRSVRVSKLSREVETDGSHLSILGCLTPEVLGPLKKGLGADGFLQRITIVGVPDVPLQRTREPVDPSAVAIYNKMMEVVLQLGEEKARLVLRPSIEALDLWWDFDERTRHVEVARAHSDRERGAIQKTTDTVIRIALGIAVTDWAWGEAVAIETGVRTEPATLPNEISGSTMRRAIRFMKDYIAPNVRAIHRAVESAGEDEDVKALCEVVLRLDADSFARTEIQNNANRFRGRSNAERLERAIGTLMRHRWLRPVKERGRDKLARNPEIRNFLDDLR